MKSRWPAAKPLGLDFLVALKGRGLKGVELVVSDDHAGLVAAIGEAIPKAAAVSTSSGMRRITCRVGRGNPA